LAATAPHAEDQAALRWVVDVGLAAALLLTAQLLTWPAMAVVDDPPPAWVVVVARGGVAPPGAGGAGRPGFVLFKHRSHGRSGTGARERAQLGLVEIVLAAEWFRREQGIFPESVEQLITAGVLDEVPRDAMSQIDEPLSYERDPSDPRRAKVWSAGHNGINTGGAVSGFEDGPDTRPASDDRADILEIWPETTYDTVVERDASGAVAAVRHEPGDRAQALPPHPQSQHLTDLGHGHLPVRHAPSRSTAIKDAN
jgi:hypothetical protein